MKIKLLVVLILITFFSFAQNSNYEKWTAMADNDISLQPEYGNVEKTESQKADDENFKKDILEYYEGDTISASKKMSDLGFTYLYDKGDFVTAMRRFNQAFMLNPKNADAYYGFGTIFFNLGAMKKAREQFDKGLELNPKHPKILTDYGTTYLGDYYESLENGKENSNEFLVKANEYLEKSLDFDKKDSNTIYKLSIVKMYIGDCNEAKKLLDKAKKMNNPNVTESYEIELNEKCN
ncbi:tetratricopeptide repeat protein [Hanstruepera ponticola]|uniref:tetratricopeptide repeat protein n=1 Tax=Hanstruepera ponticola TaxID=2042995 RepID=UPI00177D89B0|nr:tetratricopeptide repeat protein [Hanstruepera ponticola]